MIAMADSITVSNRACKSPRFSGYSPLPHGITPLAMRWSFPTDQSIHEKTP